MSNQDQNRELESSLLDQVNRLDKEMVPNRDLWPGIERAIANIPQQTRQPQNRWNVVSKVAASFAPVALVAGLWMYQGDGNSGSEMVNPLAATYQAQKKVLMQQVSNNPQVIENYSDSMGELKQAEQALVKALQSQPGDPALIKMLNRVYQQQLMLMEKAHKPNQQVKFTQI